MTAHVGGSGQPQGLAGAHQKHLEPPTAGIQCLSQCSGRARRSGQRLAIDLLEQVTGAQADPVCRPARAHGEHA